MKRLIVLTAITSLACVEPTVAPTLTPEPPVMDQPPVDEPPVDAPASPFDSTRVIEVHLELDANTWQAILDDPLAEAYHGGDIVFDGERLEDVAIRVKGNSSLNAIAGTDSHRYSFKVDINRNVADQDLLGEKKLNFNNGFKDPSLIREHLAYDVYRSLDLPAPRTSFVDLWVAGEHLGLYTMVEQVDGNFLDDNFADGDGDLYKPENPAGRLAYSGSRFEDYPGLELKRNEDTSDHSAFLRFIDVLSRGTDDELAEVLDVDQALAYVAATAALSNLDSYSGNGHNYYLYEEAGRFTVIPWDLNEAFGSFSCGCDRSGILELSIAEPTCAPLDQRPLVQRLLQNGEWRTRYDELLQQIIDGPMAAATIEAEAEAARAMIRPYVEADTTKLFSTADFERALSEDVSSGSGGRGGFNAIGLLPFAQARAASISAQLAGAGADSCSGGQPMMNPQGMGPGGRPPCGDGTCDAAESRNPNLCPRDCQPPPASGDWCGDGICDALEDYEDSCPADC